MGGSGGKGKQGGSEAASQELTALREELERLRAVQAEWTAAQDTLKRQAEQLQQYLELAGVMFVALDADGRITLANRKTCEVLGCTSAEIISQDWFSRFLPPANRAAIRAVFDQLMAGELEPVEYNENPVVARGGEERCIAWHNTMLTDAAGHITGTLSSGEDITERKRAEDALRQSEAQYRLLADNITDVIWTADMDMRTTYVSPSILRQRGYTQKEYLERSVDQLLTAESVEAVRPLATRMRGRDPSLGDGPWRFELDAKCKDGSVVPTEVTASVTLDEAGKITGLVGVSRDIRDRRRMDRERARMEAQHRTAQRLEALGRLAGGVAHDFNNLLTGILGYAGMILEKLESEHPLRPDVGEIRRAAERAASLTNQLLAFSRSQSVDPQVIQLNDAVRYSQRMLARIIGEDVKLEFRPGRNLWPVKIDLGQVDQILVNLCTNSRDSMPMGGTLTIETGNLALDADVARADPAAAPGEHVFLAVTDTGQGMDVDVQSRAFEPFFTTKSRGRGTGLGLSTVYGIVKQNGGFVQLYSKVEVGTTVRAYLPRARADGQKSRSPVPAKSPAAAQVVETVLVAEDEPIVRRLARLILAGQGYRVLEAADGREALRQCEAGGVHLLLADVVMPGLNGPELLVRLAAQHGDVRVVFMSGYTDEVVSSYGSIAGAAGFQQKPIKAQQLLDKVREVLDE